MLPKNFPDRKDTKSKEAKDRQDTYKKLSIYDKIIKLDTKLGIGVGARRQRTRYAALVEEQYKKEREQILEDNNSQKKGKKEKK